MIKTQIPKSKSAAQVPEIEFIDEAGTFRVTAPDQVNGLYFPLVNEAGLKSAITPDLNGDCKLDQNHFLLTPVSMEDLHRSNDGRNFWVLLNNSIPWSATGNSAQQKSDIFSSQADEVQMEGGFLWHRVTRSNRSLGIQATITSFIPVETETCEVMQVKIENTGDQELQITPTAAIPIYGRSADNFRDHRHVTSLLNRITLSQNGVSVTPQLTFDERGHSSNQTTYSVLGFGPGNQAPVTFFPKIESFIGDGGSLDWPSAVVQNSDGQTFDSRVNNGYEALGGLRFAPQILPPGVTATYQLILGITPDQDLSRLISYLTREKVDQAWSANKLFWQDKLDTLRFTMGDIRQNSWLRWVSLQPQLRRLFGNSFLPHFDYGRGGRGWRDLWQDCLALLFTETAVVRGLLINNFAGVRMDGTNATIIGNQPGAFIADRNNIPRVWMDHGVWPLMTIRLYIDLTGDFEILLEQQGYFRDHNIYRCKDIDSSFNSVAGTNQLNTKSQIYQGCILEHILVQVLTAFFNVGEHNFLRLEGGDWNDGLDQAADRGESVAFSSLYGSELLDLGELVGKLTSRGITTVKLNSAINILLNTGDYDDIEAKLKCLDKYVEKVTTNFSDESEEISTAELSEDLKNKGNWLIRQVRKNEWRTGELGSWFNGYYDNNGLPLEECTNARPRITLTGQVFPIMSGCATDQQVREILAAMQKLLWDDTVGGYHLNSDFVDPQPDMGRAFSFTYGHKENGAMFSHMSIMLAFALYQRGFVFEGFRILDTIYRQCQNLKICKIYPGIPEYINSTGQGCYAYLTGSASWYLYTMIWQVFGVQGLLGDLIILPKLLACQFDEAGKTHLVTSFAGKILDLQYSNPNRLDYGDYQVGNMEIAGIRADYTKYHHGIRLQRCLLENQNSDSVEIKISLIKNS